MLPPSLVSAASASDVFLALDSISISPFLISSHSTATIFFEDIVTENFVPTVAVEGIVKSKDAREFACLRAAMTADDLVTGAFQVRAAEDRFGKPMLPYAFRELVEFFVMSHMKRMIGKRMQLIEW